MDNCILKIRNLKTYFYVEEGTVKAVEGVNFSVKKQTTLGIVGESGCGKTVTAHSILRLLPQRGKIIEGEILFKRNKDDDPIDLAKLNPKGDLIRDIRGNDIAMIFQEPMSSLSPVHTVGAQMMEAILLHNKGITKDNARERAIKLLNEVGIPKPEQRIDDYTFQLSGGMRQRIMIALALSCNPKILIADEPTTAVDVTIQAKIIELLENLQEQYQMSIIMITHDLAVIAEMADEVLIMYLGKSVEKGNVIDIYDNPLHPYTEALLKSIPKIRDKSRTQLEVIKGSVPDPYSRPRGCEFEPRCCKSISGLCDIKNPPLIQFEGGHSVRCFLYTEKERVSNEFE